MMPGPDQELITRNALAGGLWGGLMTHVGGALGLTVRASAAALGLSALLLASSTFTVLKIVGVAYLLWLGVQTLRAARRSRRDGNDTLRRMPITHHNPVELFPPYANYAHAVEVPAGARTLYVSGLNGYEPDGASMPADFAGQAELVWRHLGVALGAADMTYSDLVSLRFFLASAADDPANVALIQSHLGDHLTARTVVCQQLLDPAWLIEVEAIAATVD